MAGTEKKQLWSFKCSLRFGNGKVYYFFIELTRLISSPTVMLTSEVSSGLTSPLPDPVIFRKNWRKFSPFLTFVCFSVRLSGLRFPSVVKTTFPPDGIL